MKMKWIDALKAGWQKAKDDAPKVVQYNPQDDYIHGLKQLAAYGMPTQKARAKLLLEEIDQRQHDV
jgi:hypothetical protein